jgi:hypothetical protein
MVTRVRREVARARLITGEEGRELVAKIGKRNRRASSL